MKPKTSPKRYSENEIVRMVWLAIFVSVFSFLFYNRSGDVLLYGDAVAHINIARRVFDSKTPGLLQLGTVWLPLPHLLIVPFIVSQKLWQNGAGGSIPSMAGFVFGVIGLFRLVRSAVVRSALVRSALASSELSRSTPVRSAPTVEGEGDETTNPEITKTLAWAVAITYAANPNLIYMQSTAMGEALYLAFFIWAVVYFVEYCHQDYYHQTKTEKKTESKTKDPLINCGFCLAAACLTRYDGWFLAVVMMVGVLLIEFRRRGDRLAKASVSKASVSGSRSQLVKFILLVAAAPALWLAYNAVIYRNPLEFANGPYSAKAIEQKTATVNPARGSLVAAASYFVKAAELNLSESAWQGRVWLFLALLGSIATIVNRRGRALLLLWAPLPFYAISIAYGSVPIFVPTWWPFSNYNVRYGLQLLPAFAVFIPLGISSLVHYAAKVPGSKASWIRWTPIVAIVTWLALLIVSYSGIWRADPICFREAKINSRGRVALDAQLSGWIKSLPSNSTLMMYLGEHSGALEQIGIPFRRVINEGNHRVWKQPADLDGLWERALADPAAYADYLIGFDGDPVWAAAESHHLKALVEIHTTGQPSAAIFQGRADRPR